jgi:Transposase domain (DUF772)
MQLAWRWFIGLGFDQEIPHHSTLSKNRHGRRAVIGGGSHRPLPIRRWRDPIFRCLQLGFWKGEMREPAV